MICVLDFVNFEHRPIQDEPEIGGSFQYK